MPQADIKYYTCLPWATIRIFSTLLTRSMINVRKHALCAHEMILLITWTFFYLQAQSWWIWWHSGICGSWTDLCLHFASSRIVSTSDYYCLCLGLVHTYRNVTHYRYYTVQLIQFRCKWVRHPLSLINSSVWTAPFVAKQPKNNHLNPSVLFVTSEHWVKAKANIFIWSLNSTLHFPITHLKTISLSRSHSLGVNDPLIDCLTVL